LSFAGPEMRSPSYRTNTSEVFSTSTARWLHDPERCVTARTIVRFPDPRLQLVAEPVATFDDDLRQLARDLVDTLRAAQGIGITAPHIGVPKRLVILQLSTPDIVRIYVNPKIIWASRDMLRHPEGSVAMPGVADEVERHARIRITYQDLSGTDQIEDAEGLLAVCHQHEIDQLDGLFWLQRLSRLKRDRLIKRYERQQKAF
jgi:peptide deformylase